MPDPNKCIIDKTFGVQHPYAWCVKPPEEMVPPASSGNGLSMKNTGDVVNGMLKYIDYLTLNANSASATECNDNDNQGVIGNRYLLKTNIKCKAIDTAGQSIPGDHYLHKYIDNVTIGGNWLTGGRVLTDVTGVIPSTFGSATRLGDNIFDVMSAFSGDSEPYCMDVSLLCHVIEKNANDGYKGFSPSVFVSVDDIKDIDAKLFFSKPSIPSIPAIAGFTNINENIIQQNIDKLQNVSDFYDINPNNNQDDIFIDGFYIGFSILLILIMFKLVNKK